MTAEEKSALLMFLRGLEPMADLAPSVEGPIIVRAILHVAEDMLAQELDPETLANMKTDAEGRIQAALNAKFGKA